MSTIETWVSQLPAPLRAKLELEPGLASLLGTKLDEARSGANWSAETTASFSTYVGERIADADDLAMTLHKLPIRDLFLAFSCLRGGAAALTEIDELCRVELTRAAARFQRLPLESDDVHQRVRERLFVGDGESPPKILEYRGTAHLRVWLRVVIQRILLNIVTRETKEAPTEDSFFDAIADGGGSSELAYVRSQGHQDFKDALLAAARRLSARDRSLLRYAFGDKKTVEQIGAVYGVHGATASRWVTKARNGLLAAFRIELQARLHVSETEASSLVRDALSQIEFTMNRLWGTVTR